MLWVVPDSNDDLSALLFGGNPTAIIECAERGLIELWISAPIKAEVERILAEKFSWPNDRMREVTSYLWSLTREITPRQRWPTVPTRTTTEFSNAPRKRTRK